MRSILITLIFSAVYISHANAGQCTVTDIINGHTIQCLTDKQERPELNLYQVAVPQKLHDKAKQTLSHLILNKIISFETHAQRDQQHLSTLYLSLPSSCPGSPYVGSCFQQINININMIQQGIARYAPMGSDNANYKQAEEQAQTNKIGLWADKPH